MAAQPRRHTLAWVLLVIGVLVFAGAFFIRVRRLALAGTVLIAAAAVMLARQRN